MEKPAWKAWDEFLIEAWEADMHMFVAVFRFLEPYGFQYDQIINGGFISIFSGIGVNGRSPKNFCHLGFPVRAFFYHFFPETNELLWEGKKDQALRKMRSHKISAETRLRDDREFASLKRDNRRKTSQVLPLIQGTNAIGVRQARRSLSDWGTTKPPGRMRNRRI
ncbi:MAG: hypothetical protein LiPW30_587 [Parcubacteria group bacterium LiPW_30]|nr:MAG: hypothetical protein LiPW30_587 [Parcubacteria group bacterium LiPW_30]